MIVVAAVLRRWLALAIGVLGAYIILLRVVIDAFEASIAAGFGTLAFGALVLAAVVVWRRRPAGAPRASRLLKNDVRAHGGAGDLQPRPRRRTRPTLHFMSEIEQAIERWRRAGLITAETAMRAGRSTKRSRTRICVAGGG